jgi:hypothetical protein
MVTQYILLPYIIPYTFELIKKKEFLPALYILIRIFKLLNYTNSYFTPVNWFTKFCDISMFFVTHRLEDVHISGRNMEEVYCVYNVSSYTYAQFVGFNYHI